MPQPPLSREDALAALAAVETHGTITRAAAAMGLARGTVESRVRTAKARGITLEAPLCPSPRPAEPAL